MVTIGRMVICVMGVSTVFAGATLAFLNSGPAPLVPAGNKSPVRTVTEVSSSELAPANNTVTPPSFQDTDWPVVTPKTAVDTACKFVHTCEQFPFLGPTERVNVVFRRGMGADVRGTDGVLLSDEFKRRNSRKIVLLLASWCEPCGTLLAQLQALEQPTPTDGAKVDVVVLGAEDVVGNFMDKVRLLQQKPADFQQISFYVGGFTDDKATSWCGRGGVPLVVLMDEQNRVLRTWAKGGDEVVREIQDTLYRWPTLKCDDVVTRQVAIVSSPNVQKQTGGTGQKLVSPSRPQKPKVAKNRHVTPQKHSSQKSDKKRR